MEKLLRRTILNRNQLVAKKRRQSAKDLRKTWRDYNRMKNMQDNEIAGLVKNERIARREDWISGPLASRRDVGREIETYGSVNNILAQGATLPLREQQGPRGKGHDARGTEDTRMPGFEDGNWKGTGLQGNLVVGDRVVVVKGRLGVKGKIGEVTRVDKTTDAVFVKGVNKVDMKVPPQARAGAGGAQIFEQELPVHISDVRLVTKLADPETGETKDVMVRYIHGGAPYIQRDSGSNLPRHTRYVSNYAMPDGTTSHIEIPWPKEDPDRFYTQNCDTTRDKVETRTYYPGILHEKPLEDGVINELRGEHSRLRRDWDDQEFMQKKLLEDARRDWYAERSKILSQPFWTKEFLTRQRRIAEEAKAREAGTLPI